MGAFGFHNKALRALASVKPVAEAVGKLPTFMRRTLDHVVIHRGDETAFGESDGHFFVLYSENIKTRIRNHDLEETVFHFNWTSVIYSSKWPRHAGYAKKRLPTKEDLADANSGKWHPKGENRISHYSSQIIY